MRFLGGTGTLWRVKRVLAVAALALAFPAAAFAWGGSYPTGDTLGTQAHVEVSDTIPVDQTLPQQWATYLGTLVHGTELAKLTLDLMPLSEVQAVCGDQALACYDPNAETIYASPDDQLDEPPAKDIVAHEYGHHIAFNRNDLPWSAESYGTKRWASYENICAKTLAGTVFPGDEGRNYQENSGEAFAEAYRVLTLTKEGVAPDAIGWDIVDRAFYPDATALQLLEQDITTPWTGPTVRHVKGSFGFGQTRTIGVATTLDGRFAAVLHAPTKATMKLQLYAGSKLVASGKTVRYQVCGQRELTLKVVRVKGSGAFTVDVSKP
jgi:hypothetical protein